MEGIPLYRRPTNLEADLHLAMQALKAQADTYEVDLRIECDGAPEEANVDGEKIAWAVTTLVGNSLRYVKHGTRLHPGGTIQVRLRRDGKDLVIEVQDDGAGIPAAHIPLLFRRADRRQLVGLALLMVHDVVVAHGGDVSVKSSTGAADHGTLVTLRVPL